MAMEVDWVTILGTDEYFYYETRNTSVNTLNSPFVLSLFRGR